MGSDETVSVRADDLRVALHCLRYVYKGFEDVPKGLDATFYHTLSYEGDVAEGERIRGTIERLAKEVA